eukprot:GFKZ01002885.1.p3 GENE.GFKZ01002885.1~~GFKZ01002885.1.p3  ORF type:complete len:106 (-),score=7.31 GFKZ01002885.1:280-597(-)
MNGTTWSSLKGSCSAANEAVADGECKHGKRIKCAGLGSWGDASARVEASCMCLRKSGWRAGAADLKSRADPRAGSLGACPRLWRWGGGMGSADERRGESGNREWP